MGWGYGSSRRNGGERCARRGDSRDRCRPSSRDRGCHRDSRQARRHGSRRRSDRSRTPAGRSAGRGCVARNALTYRDGGRHPASRHPVSGELRRDRRNDQREDRRGTRQRSRQPSRKSSGQGASATSVSNCSTEQESSDDEYSSYESESTTSAAAKPAGKKVAVADKGKDIEHFAWDEGMLMNSRYLVEKLLGDGTFGRVLLAQDRRKDRQVAIKVIRNVEKYTRNAKREAEILKDIREADQTKAAGCVRMFDTFTYESKAGPCFCLAFEVLGSSLYDLLKRNHYRGMWVQDIQDIAQQCLQTLAFLHDELNLTHTDLKLENVLFRSTEPMRPSHFPREEEWQELRRQRGRRDHNVGPYVRPPTSVIKLIDFGNATYELEHHSSIINTRQYRAPEVILSLGWNEQSDLWSVGCILMELYTGELLFRTHESLEHLALMEQAVERFPLPMLQNAAAPRKEQLLLEDPQTFQWRLAWPERASSATSERHVRHQKTLHQLVQDKHRSLADCVASLLVLRPDRRPSAATALMHPFLVQQFSD